MASISGWPFYQNPSGFPNSWTTYCGMPSDPWSQNKSLSVSVLDDTSTFLAQIDQSVSYLNYTKQMMDYQTQMQAFMSGSTGGMGGMDPLSLIMTLLSSGLDGDGDIAGMLKKLFGVTAKENQEFAEVTELLKNDDVFEEADRNGDGVLDEGDLILAQEILDDAFDGKYNDIMDVVVDNHKSLANANSSDTNPDTGISKRDLRAMKSAARDEDFELDEYLEGLELETKPGGPPPGALDNAENAGKGAHEANMAAGKFLAAVDAVKDEFSVTKNSSGTFSLTSGESYGYSMNASSFHEKLTSGQSIDSLRFMKLTDDDKYNAGTGFAFAKSLISKFDTNKNGLDVSELQGLPGDKIDINKDGKISDSELLSYFVYADTDKDGTIGTNELNTANNKLNSKYGDSEKEVLDTIVTALEQMKAQ